MVTRTFLDKCNTIVKDNNENFGLNPVVMLNHGKLTSRIILHFDESTIKKYVNDGTYGVDTSVKHILKMTNCASIDERTFNKLIPSNDINGVKKRATSFDVLAFRLPKEWDEGVGFDYSSDVWFSGEGAVSFEASNWYKSYNGNPWDEEGIYSKDTITKEYDKFSKGEESLVIGRQHFDHGNENLEIDISSYVNGICDEKFKNYGIGLSFTPMTEDEEIYLTQYIGFFSNHTNTFFEPFIESRCDDSISDDRNAFYLGKKNRLYLYSIIGGEFVDMDNLPTCEIEGSQMEVKHQRKGVYYVELKLSGKDYEKDTILYDTWSNLSYEGEEIDDVEQDFVTKSNSELFSVSGKIESQINYSATINGISDGEHIISNDIRMVNVIFRKKYSSDYFIVKNTKYRLYVQSGDKEVDVIDWDNIDSTGNSNFFYLDTNTLVPNEYRIDIKTQIGNELKVFRNVVRFTIEKNSTNIRK